LPLQLLSVFVQDRIQDLLTRYSTPFLGPAQLEVDRKFTPCYNSTIVNRKGHTDMFRNPFIHARTAVDWIVGIVIAAGAAGITAAVILVITRVV
jgi:hypothetical protein